MKQKAIIIELVCALLVLCFLVACSVTDNDPAADTPTSEPTTTVAPPNVATPQYTPTASYDEKEVSAPKIAVWVHPLMSYYYISVPTELAAEIDTARNLGNPLHGMDADNANIGHGYPHGITALQIFYYKTDDSRGWHILRGSGGVYGIDCGTDKIEATAEVQKLLDLATDMTEWSFETNLNDFVDIIGIEIMLGDIVLDSVTERENIAAFEDFISNSVFSITASKTQNQIIELRCTRSDGSTVSIAADPWENLLWLPPVSYFSYSEETQMLLDILGIERRHSDILEWTEYPYPERFFDGFFERVNVIPPQGHTPPQGIHPD